MKIEVYESPLSDKVIKTFTNPEEFYAWQEKEAPNLFADQVAIDDMQMLGWDEIDDELGV